MARYNKWTLTDDGVWAKLCNGCGQIRTEHEYFRDRSTYSGFKSRCAYCVNRATSYSERKKKRATRPVLPTVGMSEAEREARAMRRESAQLARLDREIAALFGDTVAA